MLLAELVSYGPSSYKSVYDFFLFAALGGVMYTLRLLPEADAGAARMLDSIAAVVIGEPVYMEEPET